MNESGQMEFDFHGPVDSGYEVWQADWKKLQATIAERWHLPLNQRVRVNLRDIPGEFVGELRLAARPVRLDPSKPVLLRLDTMTFYSNEIERCSVLEDGG